MHKKYSDLEEGNNYDVAIVELEEEIPEGLYVAVAQVLAYVFQLREYRRGRGDAPDYPSNVDIPSDMQHY